MMKKDNAYAVAAKAYTQAYQDRTKGKKGHNEGQPDCYAWVGLVQQARKCLVDSAAEDRALMDKHAGAVTSPAALQELVHCVPPAEPAVVDCMPGLLRPGVA